MDLEGEIKHTQVSLEYKPLVTALLLISWHETFLLALLADGVWRKIWMDSFAKEVYEVP